MIIKPIAPISVFPHTAAQFAFSSAEVQPDAGARIFWQLLTADGRCVQTGSVEMTPEAYNLWTNDDAYPLTYAAGVLGLTLTE